MTRDTPTRFLHTDQPLARRAVRAILAALRLDPLSRAERAVRGLSDAQLRDMGFNRLDIAPLVRHGRPDCKAAATLPASNDHRPFPARAA